MIDINAACGNWPFRPTLPGDAGGLEALLRAEGFEKACVYPIEGYLWSDPHEANLLRLPQLAESDFFIPAAVLDPTLPLALRHFDECRHRWGVPVVHIMPPYHLYDLDDPRVQTFAHRLAEEKVMLAVHLRAEDIRNRNPIYEPKEVSFSDAVALARRHPGLNVLVCGLARPAEANEFLPDGYVREMLAGRVGLEHKADVPDNLLVELSFLELNESFKAALQLFRPEQILLGTHAPIFYPRSAVMKVTGSGLDETYQQAALKGNAERLLAASAAGEAIA